LFPGTQRELRLGKKSDIPIETGDVIVTRPAGGGGYGNPKRRDPAKVARDVRDGYVSHEKAEEGYGVVLTSHNQVDLDATNRLRDHSPPRAAPLGAESSDKP